jgi:glycerophosphoryl diester phosphodiesterase
MKIVGHRGARHLAPENTLASIQKALQLNVDEIEIDVRVSSDGHVILNHDPIIRTKDGKTYATKAHTLEELRAFKPDLTTLAEVIRSIDKRVPLMIEVKAGERTEPIVSIIEKFLANGWQPSDFLLGSFSQAILRELHDALPQVETVVIEKFSGALALYRAKQIGSKKISLQHYFLWFTVLANLRQRGYEIYSYTLNNPKKARRWAKFGLSGAITDNPELYKK